MSRTLLSFSVSAALLGGSAMAEVPNVAADIAPVHSLVAQVMAGVAVPKLIVPAGASPHEYSLRPSEAAALQDAEIVFWMGEDLSPWLENAIETLAHDAEVTTLLEAEGTMLLESRESALFEKHVHGDHEHDEDDHDDHGDEDDHGHGDQADDDHDDHAHDDDEEHEHDGEDHAHDDHDDHDDHHAHGAHDPHAWLAPRNASTWLNLIAARLSEADPENASTYFANAAAARKALQTMSAEVKASLDPVRGGSFVVFHDAYQYFESDFDFPASGAISIGDATDPSPARIAEIQGRIRNEGVDCVLAEPQFNPGLVATVLEGTDAGTAVIDPLGSDLEPGPDLYSQVIRNLAATLVGCL